ncbi:MAG: cytochrome c3 family protein [Nitrospirae bacterium]|nr:cytochrome c3 family protein [Nitrospirota bacterium]
MKRTVIAAIVMSIFFATAIYAEMSAKIPVIVKLDSLSVKYEPVRFDHSKHVSIAANCGMCHHQHGDSGKLPCKECHSVTPATFKNSVCNNFMACKDCHSSYDPANPAMPGLKTAYHQTCFQCHKGMGNVGVDPKGCAEMCHAVKEQKTSLK